MLQLGQIMPFPQGHHWSHFWQTRLFSYY